jgi:hypothetical protein
MTLKEALAEDCPCPGWEKGSGWCEHCSGLSRKILVKTLKGLMKVNIELHKEMERLDARMQ